MKPYLAVLYDSFVESVRSRVLWMLLAAWTILLGVLFPLTITTTERYKLEPRSFSSEGSAKQIMDSLADASAGRGPKTVQQVYSKLSGDFQLLLQQREGNDRKISIGLLLDELNQLLKKNDLYQEDIWPTAKNRSGIKELVAKDSLSEKETERLNRRLLGLTFPNRLKYADGQATLITWAGLPLGSPFHLPIDAVRSIAETVVFPMVMRIGLGVAAMLIAIVITSAMIPDMFQTGALYLLLSKPISRSLLFLTKFLGGCIFVAINIAYLLVGLYIYAGTRLETWNTGILWCIPLFIFMFIVYYSVSAFVGLIWKNPIICVVVTAVFWAVCFGVGFLHFFFQVAVQIRPQINKIVVVNDTVITGNMIGRLQFWDSHENVWQTAYGDVDGLQLLGPVWVDSNKSLYFGRTINDVLGLAGGPTPRVDFARLPDLADPEDKTFRSKPWSDARIDSGPSMPPNSVQMLPWQDGFAVFNQEGLYAFDLEAADAPVKKNPAIASVLESIWKPQQPELPGFKPILTSMELIPPFDVCTTPDFQRILAVNQSDLHVWKASDGIFQSEGVMSGLLEPNTVALIAANERYCLVCPNGRKAVVIDIEKRSIACEPSELKQSTIKQIQVSKEGKFALLDVANQVWVLSADGTEVHRPNLTGQNNASAITFDSENHLWVAHSTNHVDQWDLASNRSIRQLRPTMTTLERVYYYGINPFYLVNPKPASVNQTIDHIMSKPEKKIIATNRNDLDQPSPNFDPWLPLWSNGLFVAVMLSLCCWYLYRQDL